MACPRKGKENRDFRLATPSISRQYFANTPARLPNSMKLAFADLKNVINTPKQAEPVFKRACSTPILASKESVNFEENHLSEKLLESKSHKQNQHSANISKKKDGAELSSEKRQNLVDLVGIENDLDLPGPSCDGTSCGIDLAEIWSEKELPDENFFCRVINAANPENYSEEEFDLSITTVMEDSQHNDEINEHLAEELTMTENDFMMPKAPTLPELPDFGDDIFLNFNI